LEEAMSLLSGKEVAEALKAEMKNEVAALKAKGVTPALGIVRMGEEPGDLAYERGARKTCEEVGVDIKVFELPRDAGQDELLGTIKKVNDDKSVHGVLLFQPLPKQINAAAARAALDPAKDMDGITEGSMAGIYSDSGKGYPPCTAESVIKILKHYKIEIAGKNVVVLGRSTVIGKPVSMLLLKENGTVTVCHSKTADLPKKTQEADIVVGAMGRALSVGKDCFRPGQYVIDVGVNAKPSGEKGTCGDVRTEEVEPIVAGITPVPGGVGSVTNANLVSHVIDAASKSSS
jgi:methylenetetrahydrofolate dehydrogenase (NADP+)/methenyltetrahydrofolate cyclohydrolase